VSNGTSMLPIQRSSARKGRSASLNREGRAAIGTAPPLMDLATSGGMENISRQQYTLSCYRVARESRLASQNTILIICP
jgi:hypothetical protein